MSVAPLCAISWSVRPCADSKTRSEEHTSELQSRLHLVCRLLLEKKKKKIKDTATATNRSFASKRKEKKSNVTRDKNNTISRNSRLITGVRKLRTYCLTGR